MQPDSAKNVLEMNLEDVLLQFAPAYCDTWPAAFEHLLTSPGDSTRITTLAAELERNGHFTEPIHVYAPAHGGPDGPEPAAIANGMHRLCAHQLTGIGPVRITYDRTSDTTGFFNATWSDLSVDTDTASELVWAAGSFRLHEHCWVTVDLDSAVDNEYTVMLIGASKECGPALQESLAERFSSFGPPPEMTWADWDDNWDE